VSELVVVDTERAVHGEANWNEPEKHHRVQPVGTLALRGRAMIGTWLLWGVQVPHRVERDAR
jgi:hypothetical protein